ncbi:ComF family protein [Lysobacter sp. A6]|uniref:ComF family protein n=1 Tax=Noviluteimonas lactosilytica TaxID=2888523 RepID=A0ABS8JHL6_9GAMM|nr:ComF family protein [Lysobacter lactosilyticus]MCC8363104.1 ComF family protein [Lysobacter lactosilyticus]
MSVAVNQLSPPQVDGLRARLGFWLRNDASRLLWPGRCLACREPGLPGMDLCEACECALPRMTSACLRCGLPLPVAGTCAACRMRPPPLREVHAACVYAAPVDRLLPRFKFHDDLAAGRLLSQLMAEAFASLDRPDALVPVPLHVGRLRSRGYDQALELARPLSRALQVPMRSRLLVRTRATAPQSERDALARRRNVRRAFAVRAGAPVPSHIALVDDVMTTGATLHAAAEALLRAGVQRVDAWVCARAP